MCIVIVTTAHPDYPLILLSNRDEYLTRPTAPASFWSPPHSHILGGRDLQRPEQGTWLGVTRHGRLACLTNFREKEEPGVAAARPSRGAVVNAFLTAPPPEVGGGAGGVELEAHRLLEGGLGGVGGFSLLFGNLAEVLEKGDRGLAVVSNRSSSAESVRYLSSEKGSTHALSNSSYGDRSWPKVVAAEGLVESAVMQSTAAGEDEEELVARLFDVLSTDTLPKRVEGQEMSVYLLQLRNSIFIPRIGDEAVKEQKTADELRSADMPEGEKAAVNPYAGVYGTQKQTLLLLNKKGRVVFIERTLFDEAANKIRKGDGDRRFEFNIER